MLRLWDERTAQLTEVRAGHRGELRILVTTPPGAGLGQLRVYLTADLTRRYAERTGALSTVCDIQPDGEDLSELRAGCDALNVHPTLHTRQDPAAFSALFPEVAGQPVFDLGVCPAGFAAGEGLATRWIEVAPEPPDATAVGTGDGDGDGDGTAGDTGSSMGANGTRADRTSGSAAGVGTGSGTGVAAHGGDPLAVRLALLRYSYREPALAGADELAEAGLTLARWRELVAKWATSPSTAISQRYSRAMSDAFGADLDTAAALAELAALDTDAGEADGTKFETFAAADRLLGLDLARDIGRF